MKTTIVVGGSHHEKRPSSIVAKLAEELDAVSCNGYFAPNITCYDLVIWMPDIPNNKPKNYPVKDKGAVLICSKVMRKGYTKADAVARIFKMHGNAVICIYKDNPNKIEFELIDALGNAWCNKTSSLTDLARNIMRFHIWSKGQVRISYAEMDEQDYYEDYLNLKLPKKFVELNTLVADKVENSLGARYFGNFSTRCMKLFPSMRKGSAFLFSPRNVDKSRLTEKDFVLVMPPYYMDPSGDHRKYSVDAPTQVAIYQQFPDIKFMIHGHAFVSFENVPAKQHVIKRVPATYTKNYYPCGDLREVEEVAKIFRQMTHHRAVNLNDHGFLLATSTLDEMEALIGELKFEVSSLLSG